VKFDLSTQEEKKKKRKGKGGRHVKAFSIREASFQINAKGGRSPGSEKSSKSMRRGEKGKKKNNLTDLHVCSEEGKKKATFCKKGGSLCQN